MNEIWQIRGRMLRIARPGADRPPNPTLRPFLEDSPSDNPDVQVPAFDVHVVEAVRFLGDVAVLAGIDVVRRHGQNTGVVEVLEHGLASRPAIREGAL